ncbi:SpoVT / AbrB like domain protein [Synechococcus sp. PCC 7335]|uniref:AbrB/MazE/SpoVT family DNA-binding domain-containing protein n=1 Tax=Synechococcus sp. (strain ATCC 29403 / PCC 7335) TaxID=91464 RepID=UPI00017EE117|nr:AbrB/MazE/SpoVT family DNA-binding domain-containing protein [Synechococcus sp. PCC 7335]EDX83586.1 SpoVT / AbrB like domain protein [Synechococcus sp. PCC 7335]
MASSAIEVKVGDSGRLVIPAELRHQMDLHPGDRLVAQIDDEGRLTFEKAETIKQRLKQQFAHLKGQGVIDDLIDERRAAARMET